MLFSTLKVSDWLGDLFGAKIWRFPEFKHFVNTYNWTTLQWMCFLFRFFRAPKEWRYYHWWFRCCTSHCGRTLLGGWRNHPIEVPKKQKTQKRGGKTWVDGKRIIPRWWFQIFFIFTPTWGNDPIWLIYFSNGLKPPTRYFRGIPEATMPVK